MSDINVYITSDLTSSERRISPQWDIQYLKKKLELITGIAPKDQTIQHYAIPSSNEFIVISDANKYSAAEDSTSHVSDYNVLPFSRLHIHDNNPDSQLNQLQGDDATEEFKLSEEEYAKRTDSVLHWKSTNKLGRFDPEYELQKARQLEENLKISSSLHVGDRCRIINIEGERRGAIKYVGKIMLLDEGENVWVGIEFDEPVGKNNGSISGTKIFECRENHGSFVKPKQVEVGDFPELDPFASDDDDDEI
ncbi:DEHA2E09702p [Debaryomyces hansenii CBS767]|uniref:DEHA2E09702p n=1 Tax=Debaryomyces hansenii (strain ATCC 36239 / CBS 767 / BCRC 21394 / JCM 1990 / NBRC 0083 / IGC 2968) TaxID=284592 RepID=Q6BPZ3_DEBHA|nr:DEHA2E09702p [Debaryomyces hansenii CBS767]CAG87963.2 DEHA2E09702p [Debaryomyces hansenii CBS767]|eukprot:XP_459727.2 DEHA2E09702p [Debaryomyces hansenii CBS767]